MLETSGSGTKYNRAPSVVWNLLTESVQCRESNLIVLSYYGKCKPLVLANASNPLRKNIVRCYP